MGNLTDFLLSQRYTYTYNKNILRIENISRIQRK